MLRHLMKKFALLIMLALSSGCASRYLYYPDHQIYQTPQQVGLKFEEINFTSRDGTPLTGWFVPAKGVVKGTVIHFHGNAQNISPTPLVLIHGASDSVVPYHHAQALFNQAREPKQLWAVEGDDHGYCSRHPGIASARTGSESDGNQVRTGLGTAQQTGG